MQKSLKCKIKLGLNVKLGKGQMQNYILAKNKSYKNKSGLYRVNKSDRTHKKQSHKSM